MTNVIKKISGIVIKKISGERIAVYLCVLEGDLYRVVGESLLRS